MQRRLSIHQGRALITTTPYYLGWLKTEVADRAESNPDYDLIRFESTANPAFPPEEWARAEATLPGWKFDLFYRALWSRPAGLIYDNWTEADKVAPFPIPPDWPRYAGIDFGGLKAADMSGVKQRIGHAAMPRDRLIRNRRVAACAIQVFNYDRLVIALDDRDLFRIALAETAHFVR